MGQTELEDTSMRSRSFFPVLWPWNSLASSQTSLLGMLRTRRFTLLYLLITFTILILIGLGDPRLCETEAQILICSAAIWPAELFTAPHKFTFNWFTALWFMHAIDQVIFCTVGFLIFTQSYECRAGTKNAIILCLGGTIVASIVVSLGLNIGHLVAPDSAWINHSLDRSWMGGSVAFYATIGGLSHFARTPWVMIGCMTAFETGNHFLNGISITTNSAHLIAMMFGFIMGIWLHPKGILPSQLEKSHRADDG